MTFQVDSLKTKDKQIEKLKKEIDTLKNINNKDLIMKLTHSEHEVSTFLFLFSILILLSNGFIDTKFHKSIERDNEKKKSR